MRPNVSELIFLLVAFVETIFSWGCSYDNLSNEIWILLLWYNTAPSTPPARHLYLKFVFLPETSSHFWTPIYSNMSVLLFLHGGWEGGGGEVGSIGTNDISQLISTPGFITGNIPPSPPPPPPPYPPSLPIYPLVSPIFHLVWLEPLSGGSGASGGRC